MSRKTENTGFVCAQCGANVLPLTNGSYRNHCHKCLYSLHMDNKPGDRKNNCRGLMQPLGFNYSGKKGWQITHRCQKCGTEKINRAAPDDIDAIIKKMRHGGFL